ncbi:MAG: hypothetical protein FD174_837 [Geobacteraceae bacterium]|nr:MAG: hypothetical protein FD174_837 [Geobacteraceae bacterium]
MKRLIALLVSVSLALTTLAGCYGKFALTRKVYAVNGEVKDKYLRSLVTWAFVIVPVYGVSAFVDFILFNTIEFWSGNNPVAEKEKDFFYVDNGEYFHVNATRTGNNVRYNINHYKANKYVDSLVITWDVKTGNSTSIFRGFDSTTEFVATLDNHGVTVQRHTNGVAEQKHIRLASYR